MYGIVSRSFVTKHRLRRVPILERTITGFEGSEMKVKEVAQLALDIGGHYQPKVFLYIVPRLESHDILLGIPWLLQEKANILMDQSRPRLRFQRSGLEVYDQARNYCATKIEMISAAAFAVWNQPKYKRLGYRVFAASLADIEKALRIKEYTDPRMKLPAHYHEYLSLFDRKAADTLPPLRGPGIDHRIELELDENGKEKEPPWGPLYNMSRDELLVLRKTLTELLDKSFIRVSAASAAAPVLFVHKPGGGLRFCVDYRGLNKLSKKDRYPLPLITETLERIAKARWFTKLDVIAAFHRIRIAEGDEWKTAFRTRYGLFEWLVTPFGLANAPSTFQKYINWSLRDFLDEFASAYLDDVLVFSSGSLQDHREKVKKVLQRLSDAGLQLDIDKCEFEVTNVKYLGFIVDANEGISMDPEKVRAIKEWVAPHSVKGVRAFLGFANFYRRFIRNFSDIVAPLVILTKKDSKFEWSSEADNAFMKLKELFVTAPALASFDPDRETVVETDSSGYCIGGLLSQYGDDGLLYPCAYYSKKNVPAECNYEIYDKELLAIVRCLQEWESELRSVQSFEVISDHRNLRYFTTLRRLTERQMRWADFLSKFNFTITYRAGKSNVRADALSRREQDMPKEEDPRITHRIRRLLEPELLEAESMQVRYIDPAGTASPVRTRRQARLQAEETASSLEEIATDEDEILGEETNAEESPLPPRDELMLENQLDTTAATLPIGDFEELWDEAMENDEFLRLATEAVRDGKPRFPRELGIKVTIAECSLGVMGRLLFRGRRWVPESEVLRTRIMQGMHDSTLTGHPGRAQLYALVAREFYWPNMSNDIKRFVRNCDRCGSNRIWRERRQGLLKPLPLPDRIWREISIDFITDLPESNGCTNIMVITDRLSKGTIFEPMAEISAEAVAERFIQIFYRHHGFPHSVVSDRGTQFVGKFWKRFCQLVGIKRRLSTAYHPETDGSTERMNQNLEAYIRLFANYAQSNWAPLLTSAELAINNHDAASTGVSPFFLTHGYHLEVLQLTEETMSYPDARDPVQRAENMITKLKEAREMAQASMALAQQSYEDYSNRSRDPATNYKVGDKVWLDLRHIKTNRPCKKLDVRSGKYTVLECIGTHAYRLNTPPGIHNVFHTILLRPAAADPFPSQMVTDWQPPAILIEDEEGTHEEWLVEEILDERIVKVGRGQREELYVKWTGYATPTWTAKSALEDTEALDRYEERQRRNKDRSRLNIEENMRLSEEERYNLLCRLDALRY